VNNVALSKALDLNPASVLQMVRKLSQKKLVETLPDKSIRLTERGKKKAIATIRKHRLWEVFLVDKLEFRWDEVHDIAEELEHIESEELILRLEKFLGNPKFDPHGDPVPDNRGVITKTRSIPLSAVPVTKKATISGLRNSSNEFLNYLDRLGLAIGDTILVSEKEQFDKSITIMHGKKTITLSHEAAVNILVRG
jgi:DtxR family transcriptional regulator, Mn-dependent transcriptional regulator